MFLLSYNSLGGHLYIVLEMLQFVKCSLKLKLILMLWIRLVNVILLKLKYTTCLLTITLFNNMYMYCIVSPIIV